MFRDSRPFGQVLTDTASEFPAPRTVAGAIRTWLLTAQGVDLSVLRRLETREKTTRAALEQICPKGAPAHWVLDARLGGPVAYGLSGRQSYFPAPGTLATAQEKKANLKENLLALQPLDAAPEGWKEPKAAPVFRPLWIAKAESWEPLESDWFVDASSMRRFLMGKPINRIGMRRQQDLFHGEPRLGIHINSDRGTTVEGDLYASVFLRPVPGHGFAVMITAELSGLAEKIGVLLERCPRIRLGGEGKFARLSLLDEDTSLIPAPPSEWPPRNSRGFFTCLATPGLFQNGGCFPEEFSKRYALAGATVNTPRTVSGWDVGHNRPLPYRSAAPAGSVYFWQLKEGAQWGEDPHGTCISDNEDDNQAGWGLCLRGDWQ